MEWLPASTLFLSLATISATVSTFSHKSFSTSVPMEQSLCTSNTSCRYSVASFTEQKSELAHSPAFCMTYLASSNDQGRSGWSPSNAIPTYNGFNRTGCLWCKPTCRPENAIDWANGENPRELSNDNSVAKIKSFVVFNRPSIFLDLLFLLSPIQWRVSQSYAIPSSDCGRSSERECQLLCALTKKRKRSELCALVQVFVRRVYGAEGIFDGSVLRRNHLITLCSLELSYVRTSAVHATWSFLQRHNLCRDWLNHAMSSSIEVGLQY